MASRSLVFYLIVWYGINIFSEIDLKFMYLFVVYGRSFIGYLSDG